MRSLQLKLGPLRIVSPKFTVADRVINVLVLHKMSLGVDAIIIRPAEVNRSSFSFRNEHGAVRTPVLLNVRRELAFVGTDTYNAVRHGVVHRFTGWPARQVYVGEFLAGTRCHKNRHLPP